MTHQRIKDSRRLRQMTDDYDNLWVGIKDFSPHAWLGERCLQTIRERITPGSVIVEFGSGRSTIELAKEYKIFSIEHNAEYLNKTQHATYIHAPRQVYFDPDLRREVKWYDPEVVKRCLPSKVDAVIVDGPDGDFARYGIVHHFQQVGLNFGIPILFDDMQMPYVYMAALISARNSNANKIDVSLEDGRVFGWVDPR